MGSRTFLRTGLALLMPLLLSHGSNVAAETAVRQPVAKLVDIQGVVEVAAQKDRWRAQQRAKLLFDGYTVRTQAGGSATLQPLTPGAAGLSMQAGSVVKVVGGQLKVVSGQPLVSQEKSLFSSVFESIERRWSKVARFTTVRRGSEADGEVGTPRRVTLGKDFPVLAFRNAGPSYHYRVVIGTQRVDVPAAAADAAYAEARLPDMTPGTYDYVIEVLDSTGALKFADAKHGELTWLADTDSTAAAAEQARLTQDVSVDAPSIGAALEERGLVVAAMQYYRDYVQQNPDETEVLPMLAKCYALLEMTDLQRQVIARLPTS